MHIRHARRPAGRNVRASIGASIVILLASVVGSTPARAQSAQAECDRDAVAQIPPNSSAPGLV